MKGNILNEGGSLTKCSYCGHEFLVHFTQSDLLTGKNEKCFKCGGILWLNIEKAGDNIKVASQLPFVLLGQSTKKESGLDIPTFKAPDALKPVQK